MATINITKDTVWAAGTVIKDSVVTMAAGVKLVIDKGATVSNTKFTASEVTIKGGAVIENSHFEGAFNLVLDGDPGNPVQFTNSSIEGWIYLSGSLQIDNTIFKGGSINMLTETGGSVFYMTNSTFDGTAFNSYTWKYLRAGPGALIENNVFIGAGTIYSVSDATFKNNVYFNYTQPQITGSGFTATGNNFFSNGQPLMEIAGDASKVHLAGNWWGTTDPAAILGMISKSQYEPGTVDISGYLTSPSLTTPTYMPSTMTLSAGAAMEGTGTTVVPITVTLSAPQPVDVTFTYHMEGVTATGRVDFLPLGGQRTIPAGQTQTVIQVPIYPDNIPEGPETFFVQLSGANNVIFKDGLTTRIDVTIQDDDAARLITGTAGADPLSGTGAAERLLGLGGNDTINAGAGSDILSGGAGNDRLDGGTGVDTALYTGNKSDYTLTTLADGTLEVRDNRADSPDGTDILSNIDVLVFNRSAHFIQAPAAASPFDEQTYLLFNPDVAAVVKAGAYATGHDHWTQYGYSEKGRLEVNLVDEAFYLRENPDVAAVVQSGGFASGRQHWEMYGRLEGRSPSMFFDASYYLSKYQDLGAVFGNDAKAALSHWLNFGIHEGRSASPYLNVAAYIAANPDLANIQSSGLEHFLVYGHGEGRPAPVDADWFGIA